MLKPVKEAAEAYSILSDPDRRRSYDMFGHAGVGAGAGGFEGFGFGDIFDAFFGSGFSGRGQTRNTRGSDLRYDLTIAFEEAYQGVERNRGSPARGLCSMLGNGAQRGSWSRPVGPAVAADRFAARPSRSSGRLSMSSAALPARARAESSDSLVRSVAARAESRRQNV